MASGRERPVGPRRGWPELAPPALGPSAPGQEAAAPRPGGTWMMVIKLHFISSAK